MLLFLVIQVMIWRASLLISRPLLLTSRKMSLLVPLPVLPNYPLWTSLRRARSVFLM